MFSSGYVYTGFPQGKWKNKTKTAKFPIMIKAQYRPKKS